MMYQNMEMAAELQPKSYRHKQCLANMDEEADARQLSYSGCIAR